MRWWTDLRLGTAFWKAGEFVPAGLRARPRTKQQITRRASGQRLWFRRCAREDSNSDPRLRSCLACWDRGGPTATVCDVARAWRASVRYRPVRVATELNPDPAPDPALHRSPAWHACDPAYPPRERAPPMIGSPAASARIDIPKFSPALEFAGCT